jgi:ribose 5-phosphate isomerase A
MSTQDQLKQAVAQAALDHLVDGAVIGIGSGSTVNHFIRALGGVRHRVRGAVSSSEASSALLREQGIAVLPLESVTRMPVYVDGADEIDPALCMIKGGGGALTREKIVAQAAERFVCIVDATKRVPMLGAYPLPVEVIPMASAWITRQFASMGARAVPRAGFISDNGHPILDVHGLQIRDPLALETEINQWPGVVTVGLFARRAADLALVADPGGVLTLSR